MKDIQKIKISIILAILTNSKIKAFEQDIKSREQTNYMCVYHTSLASGHLLSTIPDYPVTHNRLIQSQLQSSTLPPISAALRTYRVSNCTMRIYLTQDLSYDHSFYPVHRQWAQKLQKWATIFGVGPLLGGVTHFSHLHVWTPSRDCNLIPDAYA